MVLKATGELRTSTSFAFHTACPRIYIWILVLQTPLFSFSRPERPTHQSRFKSLFFLYSSVLYGPPLFIRDILNVNSTPSFCFSLESTSFIFLTDFPSTTLIFVLTQCIYYPLRQFSVQLKESRQRRQLKSAFIINNPVKICRKYFPRRFIMLEACVC